jgi:hypothetical protein
LKCRARRCAWSWKTFFSLVDLRNGAAAEQSAVDAQQRMEIVTPGTADEGGSPAEDLDES